MQALFTHLSLHQCCQVAERQVDGQSVLVHAQTHDVQLPDSSCVISISPLMLWLQWFLQWQRMSAEFFKKLACQNCNVTAGGA